MLFFLEVNSIWEPLFISQKDKSVRPMKWIWRRICSGGERSCFHLGGKSAWRQTGVSRFAGMSGSTMRLRPEDIRLTSSASTMTCLSRKQCKNCWEDIRDRCSRQRRRKTCRLLYRLGYILRDIRSLQIQFPQPVGGPEIALRRRFLIPGHRFLHPLLTLQQFTKGVL